MGIRRHYAAPVRSLTILAILAIAVVNAAGCGETHHDPVNPEAMLDAAARHPITSAETDIDLRAQVRGVQELSAPLRLRLSGPYVSGQGGTIPRVDWRMSASALGFPVGGHLVSTGENAFLTVYGDTYEVGTDAVAAANDRLANGPVLDPRSWFGRPRIDGEGHEGGVDCERITAPLQGDAMARDLTPLLGGLGLTEAPTASGTATACVGYDDRVLHQLEIGAVLGIPAADQAALRGATSIALDLDLVVSDVGDAEEISAPKRAGIRPIRDLAISLNDLGVPIPL
jgi:hypothetical protein